jgi:ElaB/YqjD/DUF883 family membrane-anchored ribosome-binding protein
MNDTTTNLGNTVHQALDEAADKTSDTLRPVMDMLVSGVHDAVERLAHVVTQDADKVESSGESMKDAQVRATRCSRNYIREKPLTSIGIAVASGYLLGWALRHR